MSLEVARHPTARSFLARAQPWLLAAEDRNNLMLSLAYALGVEEGDRPSAQEDDAEPPFFATLEEAGAVVGCALRIPPHQVHLTEMPGSGPVAVARALAERRSAVPAVLGPPGPALSFATEWIRLTGATARPGTDQRLYRLDDVTRLTAPGLLRRAHLGDMPLTVGWSEAFMRDVHMSYGPGEERIRAWVRQGCVYIWEDGGEAVSMAVAHGRTPKGVRIGYVYTPPERRRRGYAGACVAELSQRLIASEVEFCVLYADLSNSTTNALYQRMGYRPVTDVRDYHFDMEETS